MDALLIACQKLGSQSALAKSLGLSPQVVNNWIRRGNVPAEYCPSIERNAGVKCEDLRPDVDWDVLRNKGDCKEAA